MGRPEVDYHPVRMLSPDCLEFRYPPHKNHCSPTGSGEGGPHRMVGTLCESGVRIKILESGFGNQNPNVFALL